MRHQTQRTRLSRADVLLVVVAHLRENLAHPLLHSVLPRLAAALAEEVLAEEVIGREKSPPLEGLGLPAALVEVLARPGLPAAPELVRVEAVPGLVRVEVEAVLGRLA